MKDTHSTFVNFVEFLLITNARPKEIPNFPTASPVAQVCCLFDRRDGEQWCLLMYTAQAESESVSKKRKEKEP